MPHPSLPPLPPGWHFQLAVSSALNTKLQLLAERLDVDGVTMKDYDDIYDFIPRPEVRTCHPTRLHPLTQYVETAQADRRCPDRPAASQAPLLTSCAAPGGELTSLLRYKLGKLKQSTIRIQVREFLF